MLGEADRNFCKMLVGAFKDAQGTEHGPLMDYGRELLGVPENSEAAALWRGFYLGFSQGCRFMATDKEA